MRLLFVASEPGFGGGERIISDLVAAAQAAGHDVACSFPADSDLARRHPSVPLESANEIAAGSDGVVANDFRALRSIGLRRRRNRRVAFLCHGQWQTSTRMNAWLRVAGADVWCVSSEVSAAVVRNGHVPRERIGVLPYGADTSHRPVNASTKQAAREELGLPAGEFAVATVARFHPVKRLGMFADAVGVAGVRGLMAVSSSFGTQNESTAREAWKTATEGRADIVYRLNSEPHTVYDAADAFVSTSVRESLGVSLLEAMARGLPVVCTAQGGVQDFLLHERNCLWLPGAGVSEVAGGIRRLAEDPHLRDAFRTASLATAARRGPSAALGAIVSGWEA